MKSLGNTILIILVGSSLTAAEKLESSFSTEPRAASIVGSELQIEDQSASVDGQDDILPPYKLIITTNPGMGFL
ncbi:hypothetical protein Pmar_PMAR001147 [Perkinsus marinus ATCC 50983]|uniref:Uncharacterized protein n=1 Tax=Perkinsus marinus (strain ATCC 50983 / TXsc) TaxID=423536 RepID=C5KSZ8_PERM5|nr:hypothetical protein Pmar_PMAR001147 [Perkinsus marinus ATCC 50983]EER12348.1 hypothetical protein Pmar_PMAR001147 [Perkinsus marinus ATCC 50983]|eukprot:XP_002780553.1 hypothetical protein Pmar_PMAR001147 [Perkinsus marinus ATCC 50983]